MGVWIEIQMSVCIPEPGLVTPLVGVWIEIPGRSPCGKPLSVTPLVGVWIEIVLEETGYLCEDGHSPCGSVD